MKKQANDKTVRNSKAVAGRSKHRGEAVSLRSQLRRFAHAASNMKFACEFAVECIELLEKAQNPDLAEGLNKNINEVVSALAQKDSPKNPDRQRLHKLNLLGARYLEQLDPKYTLLARVPSFKLPDLLA